MRSPVVDEERMNPGHWLGWVLYVVFSAVTLMLGVEGRTCYYYHHFHLTAVFQGGPVSASSNLCHLPPSVTEQSLWDQWNGVGCAFATEPCQSTEGNMKHHTCPVAWPHPFFIHHQSTGGKVMLPLHLLSDASVWLCQIHSHCMVALWNRADHYTFMLLFVLLSSFFSSPILSHRRLDVCHTSTHGVVLVRI